MPVDVDFLRLRPWGRDQATAFEELCCQIARAQAVKLGRAFTRVGTPDGGVEGYSVDEVGSEHAIQAKFFHGPPTDSQWSEVKSSIRRAMDTHPRLVRLTVALPSDRADPRRPKIEHFKDKWDHHEAAWLKMADDAGRTITFGFMGKSEIIDELSLHEHHGRYEWWFNETLLSDQWLRSRLREVIAQVWPRYTPDLTVDVIAARRLAEFARLPGVLVELEELAARASLAAAKVLVAGAATPQSLAIVQNLPMPISGADRVAGPHVVPPFDDWNAAWQEFASLSSRENESIPTMPDSRRQAMHRMATTAQETTALLRRLKRTYSAPALLLYGPAGAGKTHLLCDTAALALERGQPAVVVLGHQLGTSSPWTEILRMLRFEGTADMFLQALSARAEAAGQRALLMIDAINENHGLEIWPNHLAAFLETTREYPWVGVVLGVRSHALDLVTKNIPPEHLVSVEHDGFAQAPLDALVAFFKHYGLPLPNAPVGLYGEFTNPLMLRLYCQAATRQPGLLERPMPGLTRIVDAILNDIDERARTALRSDPYVKIARPVCDAIAAAMREHNRPHLTREEATTIVNSLVAHAPAGYWRSPLAVLIGEGLLTEDLAQHGNARRPTVRFGFERIADHLHASALLAQILSSASGDRDDARRTLIVDIERASALWRPRLLEALGVLVPERLGLELPDLFAQPNGAANRALHTTAIQAWVASLTQRDQGSFTGRTRALLSELVASTGDTPAYPLVPLRRQAIKAALALSVHPDLPLGNGWLSLLLRSMPMAGRDRRWTAQIRGSRYPVGADEGASPYATLLRWCRTAPRDLLTKTANDGRTFALHASGVLVWALASPDRYLRDRATRALVGLTDHDPMVTITLLDEAGYIDDGYIEERVFAVVCGATLRDAADPSATAAALCAYIARRDVPVDVLSRDYLAVTVRHLADRLPSENADLIALQTNALPPYPDLWPGDLGLPNFDELSKAHPAFADTAATDPSPSAVDQEMARRARVAGGYVLISSSLGNHGDFHRYVTGIDRPYSFPFAHQRINELDVPPAELTPFDTSALTGWIFARTLQLGWTPQAFGAVDLDIDSDGDTGAHKRERFGKKYQWLAWHEALARLSGTHRLRVFAPDGERSNESYEGAWQLGSVRDLDPTHLLDQAHEPASASTRRLWRSQPTTFEPIVKFNDESGTPDPAEQDGPASWWLPLSWMPTPAVSIPTTADDPMTAWVHNGGDLPDLLPYLAMRRDLDGWLRSDRAAPPGAGDRRYRLLNAATSLMRSPDRSGEGYPQVGLYLDSVLIRRGDIAAVEAWVSADDSPDLDPHSIDVAITDAMYLGEWPTGAAYLRECVPDFRPRAWQDALGTDSIRLGVPAIVTTERYCWEGTILDCSLSGTLNVNLFGAATAALFPGVRQIDGVGRLADGTVLHVDPDAAPGGSGALLADELLLAEALDRDQLVLIQIVHWAKFVVPDLGGHRFPGRLDLVRLVGSVGNETLLDATRARRIDPRTL